MVQFQKHGHERCDFAVCWTYEERPAYVTEESVTSWADPFFCSSLVKSEPTWLRPKELQSEVTNNNNYKTVFLLHKKLIVLP